MYIARNKDEREGVIWEKKQKDKEQIKDRNKKMGKKEENRAGGKRIKDKIQKEIKRMRSEIRE